MGDFYSSMTGMHYSSKEQREAMEKAYMAELEKKKIRELEKINERTINGGLTNNEMLVNRTFEDALNGRGGRIAPYYLLLTLIIGIILLCMNTVVKPSIGLYVLASGFIIEGISSFVNKRKKGKKKGIYEYFCLLIGFIMIIITILPIGILKIFLPIANSNEYTLKRGENDKIIVERIGIDGEQLLYTNYKELNINKEINIKIEYYYKSKGRKNKEIKNINFNPREYFKSLEKNNIDKLPTYYEVQAVDLL